MQHKSFKHWTRQQLADSFGLKKAQDCRFLNNWLQQERPLSEEEKSALEKLRNKLKEGVDVWNEQELVIKFIALLIDLVGFDSEEFKAFANRKLSGTIDGEEVSGEVDLMVAGGHYEPKAPYFCLHEFKKEQGSDRDPYGQLLVAMMAAESLNQNQECVYGAFVTGRNWFFLTLKNRQYCISEEFVATKEDIFAIYAALKKIKAIAAKTKL